MKNRIGTIQGDPVIKNQKNIKCHSAAWKY